MYFYATTANVMDAANRSPSTRIANSPPISCVRFFAMDSPRPLPSVVRDSSPLTKRSVRSFLAAPCSGSGFFHNPSLLVLDEPNSGLDPRARVEMKELLQNLRSMGKTIVISSHILSELAEMCNSIGIMDHGKLVEAGNIEDVMEHVFGGNRIVVSVHGEMEPAVRMLKEHPQIRVESVGEKEIHISHAMKEEEIAQLIAQMIQNGIIVTGFYKEEGNLESLFMQLTGGQEDEN